MKIQKKIGITIVLSIAILFALLTNQNYAVNETNSNENQEQTNQNTENTNSNDNTNSSSNINNNSNSSNSSVNNNSTATNNTATTKSSNANLADLGIKPHDFTGFKYGTTSYEVVVPETTESVEVYAKTQDSKATLTGTGKKTLQKGENKLDVEVTAEDGTKKTYTINVVREVVQENNQSTNEVEKGEGLAKLQINELELSPNFTTNVYEYTVKYIGEDNKLNITAEPTNEDYIVEITGNDNLQEGENIITILVSEKNGDNVATYQITVNKSLIDEEAENKAKQQKIVIGAIVAAVIIIAVIVFIVIKHRKNEDFEYDDYEDEDEEEIEVPKALKNKNKSREIKKSYNELEEDEEEVESLPKEKLKEKFLDNYSNYEEDYNAQKKKDKSKGKRFKE